MDKIIRCITEGGEFTAIAIDTTNIVHTAKKLHGTGSVATAALGRLITASSMMGAMLKSDKASITLRVKGDGPLGVVIAVSDSSGNCRGYVENPKCETLHYPDGKLNVGAAVGKNGLLNVMRDLGQGEPYIGQTELVSGEIAEDITSYYAMSEQIPTVCSLGVLLDKSDGEVLLSGGLLIQALPGADEEALIKLEENFKQVDSITVMLAKGYSIKEMCEKALNGFKVEVLEEHKVDYVCTCSRERVINAIRMLEDDEIRTLANDKGYALANCHFCNKNHRFTREELEKIICSKKTAENIN